MEGKGRMGEGAGMRKRMEKEKNCWAERREKDWRQYQRMDNRI